MCLGVRSGAFPATECNEVLSGYQPGQVVDDEDRDGLRKVGFFTVQSLDPVEIPR